MVNNPYLGTGLVAGYALRARASVRDLRGFSDGIPFGLPSRSIVRDFANARTALEFIGKYQREDGKIPHEISQGANFVQWFKDYPYPYASADATPLYIIAMKLITPWRAATPVCKRKMEQFVEGLRISALDL